MMINDVNSQKTMESNMKHLC